MEEILQKIGENGSPQKLLQPTKVLLQLGLDGRTIIGSAYPSFGFGGRNSVGH